MAYQISVPKFVKFFCIFSLTLSSISLFGQTKTPFHLQLSNHYWDLISTRSVEKNKTGDYVPFFPAPLKSLNHKPIELNGYMVPIKTGLTHSQFLLSVLPIFQCQFCGQQDIPEMVQVFMITPLRFSDKPMVINGTLVINDPPTADKPTFMLVGASIKK